MAAEDHGLLYRHSKRPQWGFAVLAGEEPERRYYQFQDGELRAFKENFYHLMEAVTELPADVESIVGDLERKLDAAQARREARQAAGNRSGKDKGLSLKDQIELFGYEYEKGFQDEAWLKAVRGGEGLRALRRHRQPAIDKARELVAQEVLDAAIAEGRYSDVRDAAIAVVRATDLAGSSPDVKPLRAIEDEGLEAFALSFRNLLYGEGDFSTRFKHFLDAVGTELSWPVATVFTALVFPEEHVAVRPSTFRRQARSLMPRVQYKSAPEPGLYGNFLQMARELQQTLKRRGLKPRDLMDVHDFVKTTLRPGADKALKQHRENA